jgi:hypothetical protein
MSRLVVCARAPGPTARGIRASRVRPVSKTDQSDQTDQRLENQEGFARSTGQKSATRRSKLTNGHHGRGLTGASTP